MSIILLAILSISIIPPESFHAHEEAHVICKEGAKHIEAKKFECDLCDFVLPLFESTKSEEGLLISAVHVLEEHHHRFPISRELFDIPRYRGPPLT